MTLNTSRSNFAYHLFLCTVASGLFVFCLAVTMVSFRQHIMKYGYSIGNLEHACSSYGRKISELDRKILSMSARSKVMTHAAKGVWGTESVVVHVSKRDVRSYALNNRRRADVAVAKNFSRAN
ncbi:MAG: hypothetical protein LBS87_01520 [Puniceicoccales bacterium]|jgi:hypothetical protein|nr:hypothetical protein [Puniceicoccales bacterium]